MKTPKFLLLLGIALFVASCSKDEDAKPKLEDVALSLSSGDMITPPSAMLTSENEYAQQAAGYISLANSVDSYLSYFNKPEGATKSTTKITASNGRTAESGDAVVYTWSNNGTSIAYQISETADSYVFEIFFQNQGETDWLRYFKAEEKKDKSTGSMNIYDIFGAAGDDASVALVSYNWTRSGDQFNFTMTDYSGNFKIELAVNLKTKAGNVNYIIDGVKQYHMEWDAAGNGSWVWYDEQGAEYDSGTWTV